MKTKPFRLYNVFFPFPLVFLYYAAFEWGWLLPINYVFDTLITYLCFRYCGTENTMERTFSVSWKICLLGFAADIIGGMILVSAAFPPAWFSSAFPHFYMNISMMYRGNNFKTVWGYLFILLAVILTGILIYVFDRRLLIKHTDEKTAHRTALALAVLTAPYLFFILPVRQV